MASDQEAMRAALPLYEIQGELGHGAWGVVIAARHRDLGRDVAIKQLPRAFGSDPQVRSRFRAEARLLASLEHPHVVPIYDFVEYEGLCLLVMERLTGGTVWNRMQAGGFTQQTACAVVLAASGALHYAHARGVLHRDVKPENLMFSGKGDLKVTDFGIAKVVGGAATVATRQGDVLGTPAYMAPEQARGGELSPATDIYAVGTVLYELLSGRLPFPEDSNPVAMLYRHVHEDPEPLLRIRPDVPLALAEVVERSLAKQPSDRYHDAEEFAVAVAEAGCQSWGPGWLPATAMTVSATGPVLAAATGQTPRVTPGTVAPHHKTPRETPVSQPVAPADLVPVTDLKSDFVSISELRPDLASRPPWSGSGETQAVESVSPGPPPGPPSVPSQPAPAAPPPATPSKSRRRPLVWLIPVAIAVVIALVVALLVSGGSDKGTKVSAGGLLTPGEWLSIPPNAVARQELASAVDDGALWILGGLSGSASTPKVEGYNPSTKTWQPGPDLPLALNHEMAATYKGEIVVAGGWVGQGGNIQAATSDQVFVLRGQSWVELPRLKRPRTAGAAAVAGGKLVVFGGQGADGQLVPQTEIWDGNKWTDGASMPTPRDHLAAASDGEFVYAVGGRELSASKNLAAVDRYQPGSNKWTKLADLPQPRGDLGAAVVGRRLIAAGGEDATTVFGDVFSYDIDKKAWSGLPPMKTPRHGIAFGAVGSSVFALDGASTPKHTAATTIAEELPFTRQSTASSSATTAAASNSPWKAIPDADTARQEVASTVAGGIVYVMGGVTGDKGTAKVEGFEPASHSWKDFPDLPLPLHHSMAVTFQENPVVLGGWTAEGGNLNAKASNQVYMLTGSGWATLPTLNRPRAAGAAAVVGGKIVVVGGQGADGQLVPQTEVFDGTRWVDAKPIPTPRDHLAAVANDRFIFTIGGRRLDPSQNLAVMESYDPAANQWFQWPEMPTARGGLGAAVVNGVIYAVGGETPTEALNTVETFTFTGPLAGGWAPADPMRTPRHGVAVASLGSSLFAIDGGRKPGNADPTKTGEVLNP